MSEISKNIVSLIVSKEFHKAKTLIHEAMNNKLGILLEEKLLEYAPTLYEGEDTEYSSALGGDRYNEEEERLASIVDLDSPVNNITLSGSDATHNDSINVSPGPRGWSNGPTAREMRIRSGLGQSAPWTQDQIDQITGIPRPDADDPADESAEDGIRDKVNKLVSIALNAETGVKIATLPIKAAASGLDLVSRVATKLPGVPAAATAVAANDVAKVTSAVRGLALKSTNKVVGPVAKYAPWYITANAAYDVADRGVRDQRWYITNENGKDERAEALTDLALDTAHVGVRTASLINPWTSIPAAIDQYYNGGRVTDWVTDTIIKHGNIVADPISRVVADQIVGIVHPKSMQELQAERVNKRNLRKQDFEQALDQIGKPGKPPVAAGTVRNGSGQIMQQ